MSESSDAPMPSHFASPTSESSSVTVIDGLNRSVHRSAPPRSIVSLVPSLTEALFAMGLSEQIAGRTKYCVEPAGQIDRTPVVGGTKNPDVERIIKLQPDLVIASAEENVREHVEALIGAGLAVYVSLPTTVRRAVAELHDLALLAGRAAEAEPWLSEATSLLQQLEYRAANRKTVRYFCPIWRRPYMTAAADTYMSDLLRLCGGENIFDGGPARYYPVDLEEAARRSPDVILLPSEPYPFSTKHLPEIMAFDQVPAVRAGRVHLIDGQWITWYGPRIAPSLQAVATLFESA
jgi:ABC-type Fe3+-hydroxamate transport system substrate-binding protein